jgi:ribose transport system substrate-binding protein
MNTTDINVVIKNLHNDMTKEDMLEESDFKKYIDTCSEACLIGNVKGCFTYANNAFCNLLGYTQEEVVGSLYYTFLHPDDIESTLYAQKKLNDGNIVNSFHNRYLKKNGEYIWLTWKTWQIGTKYFAMGTEKDSNEELLSRIAHELKTPLTGIMGFAELISLNEELPQEVKDDTSYIISSVRRMEFMINNLLDMAKINRENFIMKDISLNSLIDDSIKRFLSEIIKADIVVEFHQKKSFNKVSVDENRMKNVIDNLISNAIKYNIPGGSITIKCSVDNDTLHISINNTGIGIREDKLKDLYTPFVRLCDKKKYEGNGIGLAYSKKLLDLMNVKIRCKSKFGERTTFTLSHHITEHVEDETDVILKYNNKKLIPTVLFVEDDEPCKTIVKKFLNIIGDFVFVPVGTGKDAIAKMKEKQIDILLLDLGLPDMTGLELYKYAKINNLLLNCKSVMVFSAEANAQKIVKLFDDEIDEFIPKPIRLHTFRSAIEKIMLKHFS